MTSGYETSRRPSRSGLCRLEGRDLSLQPLPQLRADLGVVRLWQALPHTRPRDEVLQRTQSAGGGKQHAARRTSPL